jgi:hypothetical protein
MAVTKRAESIAAGMQTRWPDLEEWLFGSTLSPGCHRDSGLDLAVADPAACAGEGQLSIPLWRQKQASSKPWWRIWQA